MSKRKTKQPQPVAVQQLKDLIPGYEDCSVVLTPNSLTDAIQRFQASNNLTITATADQLGIPQSQLSDVYNGTRMLGTATLQSLGLVKEVTYKRWR